MSVRIGPLVNPTPERMLWSTIIGASAVVDGLLRVCTLGLFCTNLQAFVIMESIKYQMRRRRKDIESKDQ